MRPTMATILSSVSRSACLSAALPTGAAAPFARDRAGRRRARQDDPRSDDARPRGRQVRALERRERGQVAP